MKIKVKVITNNALTYKADVLVVKYAQNLYGLDQEVARFLSQGGKYLYDSLPKPNEHLLVKSEKSLGANYVLFVGVVHLPYFRYQQIREFARRALSALAKEAPEIEHLSLTLHGVNYGLDEAEAFESEIAGLLDSITSSNYPTNLKLISFVEIDHDRTRRLRETLNSLLPQGIISLESEGKISQISDNSSERLRSAGYASNSKPSIFVAMPFDEKMDDVFHYGIQGAVKISGFLCERADLSSFTGDILQWVKIRIKDASIVIADLTTANPNVYLEVGYAWGCGKPTILLSQDMNDLKFDVKSQRCLVYKNIKQLEEKLRNELNNLKSEIN